MSLIQNWVRLVKQWEKNKIIKKIYIIYIAVLSLVLSKWFKKRIWNRVSVLGNHLVL